MKTPSAFRILPRTAVLIAGVALAAPIMAEPAAPVMRLPSQLATEYQQSDRNADGRLSLAEFRAGAHQGVDFRAADGNCDGRLDPQEYGVVHVMQRRQQLLGYLDDAWLTARVKAHLLLDDLPSALGIEVSSRAGEVHLAGRLEGPNQAARMIAVANAVEGVEVLRAHLSLDS